ncbi:MAG TPA: hypothetical protein VLW84_01415 [Terriglobales bacterium]|nr:hypothetical protein [Terriglobales bacterium]
MKKEMLVSATLLMVALLASVAAAQSLSGKTITIAGKVSDNEKTVVSDNNEKWVISNPDALMGRAGQQVVVKCRLDVERNQVQILSLKQETSETKYAASKGDSAFRR